MTKKGPLGKAEKFYIEEHCDKRTPKMIAHELDRAVSLVESYSIQYKKTRTTAGGQFGRQSGAVVMTENASVMGDDSKASRIKTRPSCITKTKKE